jgi:hypothetical protein
MFVHPYLSVVRTVLAYPRNSFRLIKTSLHGNIRLVLARVRSSFGLAESSLLNDYFCNNARTGLCCHFLWANRDIFAWQHTACLGPPKKSIKIKCRPSSLPPLGQPRHYCMALKTCLGLSKELIACHTQFHTYDRRYKLYLKQCHNEREYDSTLLHDRKS